MVQVDGLKYANARMPVITNAMLEPNKVLLLRQSSLTTLNKLALGVRINIIRVDLFILTRRILLLFLLLVCISVVSCVFPNLPCPINMRQATPFAPTRPRVSIVGTFVDMAL